MIDALAARSRRVIIAGVIFGLLALLAGSAIWKPRYTAKAMLLRNGSAGTGRADGFKPRELTMENFASIVRSPELLERVSAASNPKVPVKDLEENLHVTPERNTDLDVVAVTAPSRQQAVDLANLYAEETVRYTREMQSSQASESTHRANLQIRELDKDIVVLDEKLREMAATLAPERAAERAVEPDHQRLEGARDELAGLLGRYTEAHPLVVEQRAKIANLEKEAAARISAPLTLQQTDDPANPRNDLNAELEIARLELQPLQNARQTLQSLQREATWFINNPPGYYRVFEPATLEKIENGTWWLKIALVSVFGACLGVAFGAGSVAAGEFMDNRIKTAADLRRVTGLPILAALGDLKGMSDPVQARWAFHAWTAIRSRLDHAGGRALVCGVTASRPRQGVSTWIGLLADAARQRGARVLTIGSVLNGSAEDWRDEQKEGGDDGDDAPISGELLASPSQVVQRLNGAGVGAIIRIPLLDWVWDYERREQWKAALRQWRSVDNLVLLIELPPASQPETVMLAETLPNILWLAESGKTDAAETVGQIETLRCAGCHVIGAALNREPVPPTRSRFLRWLGGGAAAAALLCSSVSAAENGKVQTSPVTLGPGDELTISLFGSPDLSRDDITIGADGKVSFLEAQNVTAAGRTVDELRAAIDEKLAAYRRAPRTIITPVAFRSRKYYVLGRVIQPGTFPLDRPMTIVDAVARAKGLVMAPSEAGMVEQCDMKRSFLVRNGKRVPVDFERLFREGDLSQNVSIQPDDFLFFPPESPREAYLLGEVKAPGPVTLTPGMTAVRALASRGGFGDRAWTKRVLVVRGSLSHPQTYVVDAANVLHGRTRDLPLQPKDIVYASDKPWAFAEDVLDGAASAFVQSATVYWTGTYVGPFIR